MELIPAVDIMGGQAVRLVRGEFSSGQQVAESPLKAALDWAACCPERIHVIDLDGARLGKPVNLDAIRDICDGVQVPVEVGGGIRSQAHVQSVLDAGARWVILGTSLVKDPKLFASLCEEFPGRLIAAVDGRGDEVLTQGWQERSAMPIVDMSLHAQSAGAAAILYTDVDRDGTLTGPNIERTRLLASKLFIPVIASGGVSCLEDVLNLVSTGASAVVVGKALYSGKIDLNHALSVLRRVSNDEGCSPIQS